MKVMLNQPRISVVAGARPNFMKVGPVVEALRGRAAVELVHTGQHYDEALSQHFFTDLGLPQPTVDLGVGSGTHAEQTGGVMIAYERHLTQHPADAVVVVGDVNSTLAAALAAVKLQIRVAHVEAGLRSNDWTMPEEINRVVTDRISTWLFTPSADADENLRDEGIPAAHIHLVGNVMIDSLQRILPRARDSYPDLAARLSLPDEYAVLTLHRPSNVDTPDSLQSIMEALEVVSGNIPTLFSVHPRTRKQLGPVVRRPSSGIRYLEPLGYCDFLALLDRAKLVLTDSGGIQEETTVLGIPCLTLRTRTERPITCTAGTNRVVGTQPAEIISSAAEALGRERTPVNIPLWDGHAAERIADILIADLVSDAP
jgi:UDP-N-acetylglucosamine 2-epimerase (non-hydrolysing)